MKVFSSMTLVVVASANDDEASLLSHRSLLNARKQNACTYPGDGKGRQLCIDNSNCFFLDTTHECSPTCPCGQTCNNGGGTCQTDEQTCAHNIQAPDCGVPSSVDCTTCPDGFFDGCNNCMCGKDGVAGCTKKLCQVQGTPSCLEAPTETTTPAPPPPVDCKTCPDGYFDGCNNCNCGANGLAMCTLKFCFVQGTPYCLPTEAPTETTTPAPPAPVDCKTCPGGYFDGCNNCNCGANGLAMCTLMFCEVLKTPYCLPTEAPTPAPTPAPPPPVDCKTCPDGFFDGCNNCHCGANGLAMCTKMFCEVPETPYCLKATEAPTPAPPPPKPLPCGPVCMIHCEHGNVVDDKGCSTCVCNDDPKCARRLKRYPNKCDNKRFAEACPLTCAPPAPTVSCDICTQPPGYFDGCNTCHCEDGVASCTEMHCEVMGTPYCFKR